ncbi:MAG: DMT family transporter [Tahibacter sp.]
MSTARIVGLTALAMLAFAGNSLLCRMALRHTGIDAATFTTIRLVAGAAMLLLLSAGSRRLQSLDGNWFSALALFTYAACFSFAYVSLPAGSGALLLFGAVQATMIGHGLWNGERLRGLPLLGFSLAVAGLCGLLLPGLSAPPLFGSLLMLGAGVAWGFYSLRGRTAGDPTRVTAGNFLRAVPLTLLLSALLLPTARFDAPGACYAIASGALTSGLGYAIWYRVLPALRSTTAATVQLSVPVIAGLGGVVFIGEALSLRLLVASAAILGGIALVIVKRKPARAGGVPANRT